MFAKKYFLELFSLFCFFVFFASSAHAAALTIVPQSTLPTKVVVGESTTAYYLVTNNTSAVQSGIFVKLLPANVSQVTNDSTVSPPICGSTFTLAPGASCTLELKIIGAVNATNQDLAVCLADGLTCSCTNEPLNVSVLYNIQLNFAGYYCTSMFDPVNFNCNANDTFPLILNSTDSNTWTQPASVELPTDVSPNFPYVQVYSDYCNGVDCVIVGFYFNGSSYLPLILNSNDTGNTWTALEESSITPPTDSTFVNVLDAMSCEGSSCTAVGYYINTPGTYLPLIMNSTNNGHTWTSVNGLSSAPPMPSDFVDYAFLWGVDCSGVNCTATGYYYNGTNFLPLIMNNTGCPTPYTWCGVEADNISLPAGDDDTQISAVSCMGTTCISVGFSCTGTCDGANAVPLIVNGTATGSWNFVPAGNITLPSDYTNNGVFNSISCTSNGVSCTAVGFYSNDHGATKTPLIMNTLDSGNTWTAVEISNIPQPSDSVGDGYLSAVNCNSDRSLCTAIGIYHTNVAIPPVKPLILNSTNNGLTWSPVQSSGISLPSNFKGGGFIAAS